MSIRGQISETQGSISAEEQAINFLKAKLERLKAAGLSVGNVKNDLKNIQSEQQILSFLIFGWQGEQATKVRAVLVDDFGTVYSGYYNAVDSLHDSINRAATDCENEIYRHEGILGGLRGVLNSLWDALRNAIN